MIDVAFWGVRGSCSCSGPDIVRYGGNTSCVVLTIDGQEPILLDLGSGVRSFGNAWLAQHPAAAFRGSALVTHLHYDHIQGLPFFAPILSPGARLDVYGPRQAHGSLAEEFHRFVSPPTFPVTLDDFHGKLTFNEVLNDQLMLGDVSVKVASVPHTGATVGYRVEYGTSSVAYVSDHQQPHDGTFGVAEAVLELVQGVDLLIHDAQYSPQEFALRRDWGHCTVEYAVEVALRAGVANLALYHHDPSHSDDVLDGFVELASQRAQSRSALRVVAASEGLTLTV